MGQKELTFPHANVKLLSREQIILAAPSVSFRDKGVRLIDHRFVFGFGSSEVISFQINYASNLSASKNTPQTKDWIQMRAKIGARISS